MMKQYIAPALQETETEVCHMLAESLAIKDTTVEGSEALTKDEKSWDIWAEE